MTHNMETLGATPVPDLIKELLQDRAISPRRLAYTNTLLDLCRLLRGQYLLDRDSIDLLTMYTPPECAPFFSHIYTQWKQIPNESTINYYANTRLVSERARSAPTAPPPAQPQNLGELLDDHRQSVYGLIACEIGKKWREFGRELGVTEGQLDAIDAKHRDSTADKVHATFAKFEERTKSRERYHSILKGLAQVRRKDLERSVQKIVLNV